MEVSGQYLLWSFAILFFIVHVLKKTQLSFVLNRHSFQCLIMVHFVCKDATVVLHDYANTHVAVVANVQYKRVHLPHYRLCSMY